MLQSVCPFYERDPDLFWFNVCWPGTLCSTELVEHCITAMRLPDTIKVLKPCFGFALFGTCPIGNPARNVRMCLFDVLEAFQDKEGTILIPICKSGHWGMVFVQIDPINAAGTLFLDTLCTGLYFHAKDMAKIACRQYKDV